MSTYSVREENEEEKIDLTGMFYDFFAALKRTWLVVLVLMVVCAGVMYVRERVTYKPSYIAEATVSVTTDGGYSGNDANSASMISDVFPYIMSSGMLSGKIAESIGMDYVPGTVTMTNIQGTNLLTIRVESGNALNAYNVLQAVIENYDSITRFVVGNTSMEVYSDSGVPESSTGGMRLKRSLGMGAGIGLALGALVTIVYMLVYRTIDDSEDLQRIVNARYLGTLPVYRKKKRSKKKAASQINILEENIQQNYLESMRLIRTRVENAMNKHHARILMVTSSIPGEGKSTVSCNLAAALAKEGRSVVLVDCDLRNPSVQGVLGIKGQYKGIESILSGESTYHDTAVTYKEQGLEFRVIPGNEEKKTDNAKLFASQKMKDLLEELKTKADFIILDTPPAGLLVDSSYIVNCADAVLYVVMCDFTRRHIVQRGINELAETGIHILGCVLNGGKKASHAAYGYGYGYKKTGTYGETTGYTTSLKTIKDAGDEEEDE